MSIITLTLYVSMLKVVSKKVVDARVKICPYTVSLQAKAPSTHRSNATNSISVVIVKQPTSRSLTAILSMKIFTCLFRNSAELRIKTINMMLHINVANISTDSSETRDTVVFVHMLIAPSGSSVVVMFSSSLSGVSGYNGTSV